MAGVWVVILLYASRCVEANLGYKGGENGQVRSVQQAMCMSPNKVAVLGDWMQQLFTGGGMDPGALK